METGKKVSIGQIIYTLARICLPKKTIIG